MTRLPISRRHFIAGSAGLATVAAFGQSAAAQGGPLRIGVGSDPVFASYYLADGEGFFREAGVEVALQLYADGGEALNALVANQVDLGVAAEPTTMVRMERAPLRPLAVTSQSGRNIKLVLREGIAKPADIVNFGIVPGSVSEYSARLAIAHFGLDAARIRFVPSGPPELPALLARGDIDAFFAWEPWPTIAAKQGGHTVSDSGEVGYVDTQWLTAAAPVLERDTAALRNVLKAVDKAAAIVREDPERAAKAVRARARIPEETSLALFSQVTPGVRDFTDEDLQSYDRIAAFLAEAKVTKDLVPFRDGLQVGFLKG